MDGHMEKERWNCTLLIMVSAIAVLHPPFLGLRQRRVTVESLKSEVDPCGLL